MAKKKIVSDEEIIDTYERLGSVWKAGDRLGICGQSVYERLQKLGIQINSNKFTDEDEARLVEVYKSGIKRGDGKLDALSKELGRTKSFICKKAKNLGLTDNRRKVTPDLIKDMSARASEWIDRNGHPKGMKGKSHTTKTRVKLSEIGRDRSANESEESRSSRTMKMLKTKEKNGNLYKEHDKTTWKAGWREIGGYRKYYRSRWEANYARYLEMLRNKGEIESWEHEPKTFWFESIRRGTRSYLPDFRVVAKGDTTYHEVKGWMDNKSKTKLKRMRKYYPDVKLVLIQKKEYTHIERLFSGCIPEWEQ